MGQILIRDLDDTVLRALEARAAAHGVSLEAELRDVLTRAVSNHRAALATELASIRALTPSGPRVLAEDLVRESRDER
jgi:plasmid stability protein